MSEDEVEEWEDAADMGDIKVNRGVPDNGKVQVLIRVYIISVRPHFYRSVYHLH